MLSPLWVKSWREAWPLLWSCSALMFLFGWLFVWLTSMVDLGALGFFLNSMTKTFGKLSPIPLADIATSRGMVALLFVDPVVFFTCLSWAVTRGSDAVAGELGRGTMEILLAQPVKRVSVYAVQGAVTALGSLILCGMMFAGCAMGLATVTLKVSIPATDFVLPSLNVAALTLALAGLATLCSSWDGIRSRAVGVAGGFVVIQMIVKVVARLWPAGAWLKYFTMFTAYEPQVCVGWSAEAIQRSLEYGGALVSIALIGYIVGGWIFCQRDLPAPL